jgi:hypothetical protein
MRFVIPNKGRPLTRLEQASASRADTPRVQGSVCHLFVNNT